MVATIARICRYPVKALGVQDVNRAELKPGEGIPGDRRFALAHGSTRFDPLDPTWLPNTSFLSLGRHERLAALDTEFDAETDTLTVLRGGKKVVSGKINTPTGRSVIGDFFSAYMRHDGCGPVRLVEAPGIMFTDRPEKSISIVSLTSVRDLERIAGAVIDPIRFRCNLYLEGEEPWTEFNWLGGDIVVGGTRLRITRKIHRCPASEVNPITGQRDMSMVRVLQRGFGHDCIGVFAEVVEAGTIRVGDSVDAPD